MKTGIGIIGTFAAYGFFFRERGCDELNVRGWLFILRQFSTGGGEAGHAAEFTKRAKNRLLVWPRDLHIFSSFGAVDFFGNSCGFW